VQIYVGGVNVRKLLMIGWCGSTWGGVNLRKLLMNGWCKSTWGV